MKKSNRVKTRSCGKNSTNKKSKKNKYQIRLIQK